MEYYNVSTTLYVAVISSVLNNDNTFESITGTSSGECSSTYNKKCNYNESFASLHARFFVFPFSKRTVADES